MPVVMVSTLTVAGAEETLRALELGAIDCVSKPGFGTTQGDFGDLAERSFQVAGLAREHQRRMGPKARKHAFQRRLVRVIRHLAGRLFLPALRGPAVGAHRALLSGPHGPWVRGRI